MLDKDSMLIVPKKQIQTIPGLVDNDACNFDFFNHSIRPTKNHKRDLQQYLEKYKEFSISNIKLPELRGTIKIDKSVRKSDSLRFKYKKPMSAAKPTQDKTDLDLVLKNIRQTMVD